MIATALLSVALTLGGLAAPQPDAPVPIARFVEAASPDERISDPALTAIRLGWRDGYTALIVDLARLMRAPQRGPAATRGDAADSDPQRPGSSPLLLADPGSPVRRRLLQFLQQRTGQRFGDDLDQWRAWMWRLPDQPHPDYAAFKRLLYGSIDPRMREFSDAAASEIRLDRIDWGGVAVNGIPPLRAPAVVAAAAASYLADSNVVFGLVVNGEARAYPKRILAWHEMAIDRVGGVDLTVVYCTLCGTVIPFESTAGGRTFRFGTSGLLYESNKLMFDEDTHSLWSTFEGRPVVGPLVGSGIVLRTLPVVTTTWKAWRRDHPATTVLSLDTGHRRDYSEGAAYRDYFASDRLMFQVSQRSDQLRTKDEVLVMQLPDGGKRAAPMLPVALDVAFLRRHPVFSFVSGGRRYVVVTDAEGANRVYAVTRDIPEQLAATRLVDATGEGWRVTEEALIPDTPGGVPAPRVAAQRAFWFGWFAQFPQTRLIK